MAQRDYHYIQVDVFTRRPFGGNQLAVFTDARGLADSEMQAIAAEMNFSESTFVLPPNDPEADARVRIFTPGTELPFAGHPTVGSAFVLGRMRRRRRLRLELGVGTLDVEADAGGGRSGDAWMDQPLPTFEPVEASAATLAALLDLAPDDVSADAPAEFGSAGVPFLYLPLRTRQAVARASGNLAAIQRFFGDRGHPAMFFFSLETESPDASAHGRMLSLLLGKSLREDPATGSACGPLGAYLVRHGLRAAGRLVVEQGYEMGRPSQVEVDIEAGAGGIKRIRVGGGVVLVAEGRLFLDAP